MQDQVNNCEPARSSAQISPVANVTDVDVKICPALLLVLNTSILLSQVLPICGTDKVMKKHLQSDYFKNQQAAISKQLRNQQSFNTKIRINKKTS